MEGLEFESRSKGGRPKQAITRCIQIKIRLTETEYSKCKANAGQVNLTVVEYFRQSAIHAKVVPRFTPEDLKNYQILAGIGNNLNQQSKLAHQNGLIQMEAECRSAIKAVSDHMEKFDRYDREDNNR